MLLQGVSVIVIRVKKNVSGLVKRFLIVTECFCVFQYVRTTVSAHLRDSVTLARLASSRIHPSM